MKLITIFLAAIIFCTVPQIGFSQKDSTLKSKMSAGFGGAGYGLKISKNKNVSASTVVNNPGQEIEITQGWFIFDVSMNIHTIPVLCKAYDSYGGFMTGLQLGYTFSLSSSNWSYGGGSVTSGPSLGLNMVYVKLVIGGTGFHKL